MITPNINTQPHLGRFKDNYRPENSMHGYLALARVLKVHHANNTVDVQIVRTNDRVVSSEENQGRQGARVLVSSAGYTASTKSSHGVVEPITKGQLVILAFLEGFKSQPVIMGSLHNTWESSSNILTGNYPISEEGSVEQKKDALKYLRVFPSQLYTRVDGIGGVELSHPSKTFLKISSDFADSVSDVHDSFDHDDLREKDPNTNKTLYGKTEESALPVKILFAHRSSCDDLLSTWTKIFLASNGLFRLSRDNRDSKLTYVEISETGTFSVKRLLDTDDYTDSSTSNSKIQIAENGQINISTTEGTDVADVQINSTGVGVSYNNNKIDVTNDVITLNHKSGSSISMLANGDIVMPTLKVGDVINGNYVQMTESGITLLGNSTVWVDVDFPIIIRTSAANIPTMSIVQGNISAPLWSVNDYVVCEGQEFIHKWKQGSPVYWHVHMLTNGQEGTDKYVKWEVEWFWVNSNNPISATQVATYEFKIPANTPTKTMFVVNISGWTPTNGLVQGHCYARLKRIASSGTAPTGNPWCTMLQLHVECDGLGSNLVSSK